MRAVFLDKDGTLIENVPYNVDIQHIKLTQGAIEGLRLLEKAGYKLIVITNQSGVARGYFPESALLAVENHLRQVLADEGISLTDFYYCPHHPKGIMAELAITCDCRKPAPGMLLRAACQHNIDLENSWFIGDILNDVEAGRRAGCKTILIDNGNETEWQLSALRTPDYTVSDLAAAAQAIISTKIFPRDVPPERLYQ
ncbi:HAD family hydrolase [Iningainema sp. BLCCT55]|uniref:D,D-heptose 1,7-bisphosphate phosphatase n=2 Tax=Iningainema TaxID=1932705 RepID=A0A8J6XRP4_9CYAN|nr:HAD family hydrolase [Iningainema tapete BLCC-T55]